MTNNKTYFISGGGTGGHIYPAFTVVEKLLKEEDNLVYARVLSYKENNNDVIFTFDTHDENYMETEEGKHLPILHCLKGEYGHQLYGRVNELFNKEKDIYFEKPTFPSLELANYLKDKDYKEIEICGLVSNICVLSNVIMVKSALPNAKIIVDRQLTSSFDEILNEYTFEILKGILVSPCS